MLEFIVCFARGFVLSAALIVAIGAQNLFVLRQGLRREHIGAIVLFCGIADATLIAIGVSGISSFLKAVPQLEGILTIGGAVFLLWHSYAAFARVFHASNAQIQDLAGITLQQALLAAAGFTFLNPHVYLDTVLLMGIAGSAQPEDLRAVFAFGAAMASMTWFTALGYGARLLLPLFTKPKAWQILDTVIGTIMLALAVSLLLKFLG